MQFILTKPHKFYDRVLGVGFDEIYGGYSSMDDTKKIGENLNIISRVFLYIGLLFFMLEIEI